MFCTVEEAYKILNLEDPILFQNRVLDLYLTNMATSPEAEELFLSLRRTGKTTYYAVEAAIYLLSGRDVYYFCFTMAESIRIKELVNNYLHRIVEVRGPSNVYCIGQLKVERTKSSNKEDILAEVAELLMSVNYYNYYAIFDIF